MYNKKVSCLCLKHMTFQEKLKTLPDLKFCGKSLNSVESHTVSGTLRGERH